VGLVWNSTERVYGAAIAKAYELEHEVAQLPRIVLGSSLIEFLQTPSVTALTPRDQMNQGFARASSSAHVWMLTVIISSITGRFVQATRRHAALPWPLPFSGRMSL